MCIVADNHTSFENSFCDNLIFLDSQKIYKTFNSKVELVTGENSIKATPHQIKFSIISTIVYTMCFRRFFKCPIWILRTPSKSEIETTRRRIPI